ncbi:hypothetical protein TNIN_430311 [Trichonephila inaurata madagascariensis]|uniref:Uncharacterized protein n=1 Tax=Trichonephila inaurata madagascariensis TaxID=2747483 RepID=A0A8X6IWW3_9ARAC|nr:hypothetical protein TNIN_430311 [Trichonephila inaurata madagascariensis]
MERRLQTTLRPRHAHPPEAGSSEDPQVIWGPRSGARMGRGPGAPPLCLWGRHGLSKTVRSEALIDYLTITGQASGLEAFSRSPTRW